MEWQDRLIRIQKKADQMVGLELIAGIKLRGQDLNLRPRGYEPRELPGCSTPHRYSSQIRRLVKASFDIFLAQMLGSLTLLKAEIFALREKLAWVVIYNFFDQSFTVSSLAHLENQVGYCRWL